MHKILITYRKDNSRTQFFKKKFLAIILFCCFTTFLGGQTLSQMETNYQNLVFEIQSEQLKLDSLNSVYKKMISFIDKEKQKVPANENTITEMLAEAVVISNQISQQQIQIDRLDNQLESIKNNLNIRYAAKIDSIELLEKSDPNATEKESLKSQRMKYIEKRLAVSPKIYSLSFDPQKLIAYRLSSKNDSLEHKIYSEYLQNALEEINKQSHQVAQLKDEISEVVNLQNETANFLEDIDSEIMFNPALKTSPTLAAAEPTYFSGEINSHDRELSAVYLQANSYLHIFNQLKTTTNIDDQSLWLTPTDTIPANLTFQQYLDLLQDVDKMLQDYRTLLEHKLESN